MKFTIPLPKSEIGKSWLVLYLLWIIIASSLFMALYRGDWSLVFVAFVVTILTLLPIFLPKKFDIYLPTSFIAAINLFIFATIFLGEFGNFYERFWWWDLVLHSGSALGFGLLGVAILLILLGDHRIKASPFLLSIFAFTFAMSIGAMWELYEFFSDSVFGTNMLKSGLNDTISDLAVNSLGALLSAVIGYGYLKNNKRGVISGSIDSLVKKNIKK